MDKTNLPPLPIAADMVYAGMDAPRELKLARARYYTAEQMHEYAARAVREAVPDEDRYEQFVQAGIARSPEPLRELGEYLTRVLDEDEWPNADRLLLQLATQDQEKGS